MKKTMEDFWIKMGWYEYPYADSDTRVLTRGRWEAEWVRGDAVRFLVDEVLKKDPRDVAQKDFNKNMLSGLLNYYKGSPYMALKEANYNNIKPWEMKVKPMGFFKKRRNRVFAVKRLIRKLNKDIRNMNQGDFNKNRLCGLLSHHYGGSPYKALREVGYKIKPWEMHFTPLNFYRKRGNRIAAIRWLVNKLNKPIKNISGKDFQKNRLGGLSVEYYRDSPYCALKEAGYEIEPWEMSITPRGFYEKRENRISAIRWLVKKLGKNLRDITQKDFNDNGLLGLLEWYYAGSPYRALKEADYKMNPWEMQTTPTGFFRERKNRVVAMKWLIKKIGKDPRNLGRKDFEGNRLGGLLTMYYNGSPYAALREVGYKINPWEMQMTPMGFFKRRKNRITAIKWLIIKLRKSPVTTSKRDFYENGLCGLLSNYYNDSPRKALQDAGFNDKNSSWQRMFLFSDIIKKIKH